MKFTPSPDWDPYADLVELKNFAMTADTHIANIMNNEKQIIKAVNELSAQLKQMEQKIKLLEGVINEIARS